MIQQNKAIKLLILIFILSFAPIVASAAPFAYITNFGSNNVSVIDTSTNTVTATVTVGTNPFGIFISPGGASETTPPVPTSLQNSTGNDWVNYTWIEGTGIVTDGYNVTMNNDWYNTTETFLNSTVGAGNWSNIAVWAWNATGDGNMSTTSVSDNVQASTAPTDTTPTVPTDLLNTTGNDWVNFTWIEGTGIVTDGYNVTMNDAWYNTTDAFLNSNVGAGNWSKITVWAWNATGDGNMSATNVSDNVQATAAPTDTIPPVPTDLHNSTGNDWVNYTWMAGSGVETDGYNVTMNDTWYNTTNTFLNSTVGAGNWSNITVWAWNATGDGNMSVANVSDTVQAQAAPTDTTPPVPTSLQSTTGNYWVNYTWTAGTGIVTDSYNVSMNDTWANTTNTYLNVSVGPSGWANISVWAWNATGDGNMSAANVSDNVQAPAIILHHINVTLDSWTMNINESKNFNATGFDYINDQIDPLNITFAWYTTPSGVGTLNATTGSVVNFTALNAGRTEIYAINGSVSSNVTYKVWITVNAPTETGDVANGTGNATSGNSTAIVNLNNESVNGTITIKELGHPLNETEDIGNRTGLGTDSEPIKGVNVTVNESIVAALNDPGGYVHIGIIYNQSQIDDLGIDEDTLFIYKFVNGTGWVKLLQGNPSYCIANGRDIDENYIWVNVTNASTFLLAGTPTVAPTPTPAPTRDRSSGGSSSSGGGASGELYENIACSETDRQYVNQNSDISYSFDLDSNIVQ
ncbi:MAG: hypothetical protein GQ533_04090, partial [Methanosarcinaceae archaeon]|nr:hypothetical protein [Methanosarcinaceae archaeon]